MLKTGGLLKGARRTAATVSASAKQRSGQQEHRQEGSRSTTGSTSITTTNSTTSSFTLPTFLVPAWANIGNRSVVPAAGVVVHPRASKVVRQREASHHYHPHHRGAAGMHATSIHAGPSSASSDHGTSSIREDSAITIIPRTRAPSAPSPPASVPPPIDLLRHPTHSGHSTSHHHPAFNDPATRGTRPEGGDHRRRQKEQEEQQQQQVEAAEELPTPPSSPFVRHVREDPMSGTAPGRNPVLQPQEKTRPPRTISDESARCPTKKHRWPIEANKDTRPSRSQTTTAQASSSDEKGKGRRGTDSQKTRQSQSKDTDSPDLAASEPPELAAAIREARKSLVQRRSYASKPKNVQSLDKDEVEQFLPAGSIPSYAVLWLRKCEGLTRSQWSQRYRSLMQPAVKEVCLDLIRHLRESQSVTGSTQVWSETIFKTLTPDIANSLLLCHSSSTTLLEGLVALAASDLIGAKLEELVDLHIQVACWTDIVGVRARTRAQGSERTPSNGKRPLSHFQHKSFHLHHFLNNYIHSLQSSGTQHARQYALFALDRVIHLNHLLRPSGSFGQEPMTASFARCILLAPNGSAKARRTERDENPTIQVIQKLASTENLVSWTSEGNHAHASDRWLQQLWLDSLARHTSTEPAYNKLWTLLEHLQQQNQSHPTPLLQHAVLQGIFSRVIKSDRSRSAPSYPHFIASMSIVKNLLRQGHIDEAEQTVQSLTQAWPQMQGKAEVWQRKLQILLKRGLGVRSTDAGTGVDADAGAALVQDLNSLLREMQALKVEPDRYFYATLLDGIISLPIHFSAAYQMQSLIQSSPTSAQQPPSPYSLSDLKYLAFLRSDMSLHEKVAREEVQVPWQPELALVIEAIDRLLRSPPTKPPTPTPTPTLAPSRIEPLPTPQPFRTAVTGSTSSKRDPDTEFKATVLAIRYFAWSGNAQGAFDSYTELIDRLKCKLGEHGADGQGKHASSSSSSSKNLEKSSASSATLLRQYALIQQGSFIRTLTVALQQNDAELALRTVRTTLDNFGANAVGPRSMKRILYAAGSRRQQRSSSPPGPSGGQDGHLIFSALELVQRWSYGFKSLYAKPNQASLVFGALHPEHRRLALSTLLPNLAALRTLTQAVLSVLFLDRRCSPSDGMPDETGKKASQRIDEASAASGFKMLADTILFTEPRLDLDRWTTIVTSTAEELQLRQRCPERWERSHPEILAICRTTSEAQKQNREKDNKRKRALHGLLARPASPLSSNEVRLGTGENRSPVVEDREGPVERK